MAFKLTGLTKVQPNDLPAKVPTKKGGRHRAEAPKTNKHYAQRGHQETGRLAMADVPGVRRGKR